MDERHARAAWSRLTEPGDEAAAEVIAHYGAVEGLAWVRRGAADPAGLPPATRVHVERWAPRLAALDPARDLHNVGLLGGSLLIPSDDYWPAAVDDLGAAAPHALWVRGDARLLARGGVSIVGSRASTRYGDEVATELGFGIAERGFPVISGGAYGIDARAHRGALAAGGAGTVAVLAGGVDRLYPAGNADLLGEVIRSGALISELPPGSVPARFRFLARNRIIAALGRATVVVEAGYRSGALSTAHHAAGLMRPVGAVPGPVTSAASAGCHRLLREGAAVCVGSVEEVLELAGPMDAASVRQPEVLPGLLDGLDPVAARIFDAMPARTGAEIDAIVRESGLAPREVLAGLGTLQLAGKVTRAGSRWKRAS